jgi:hypothetical protein
MLLIMLINSKNLETSHFLIILRYGICLVGIKRNNKNSKIRLNPGHSHIILASDRLYYIALTNEESLTDFLKGINDQKEIANFASQIARKGIT